MAPTSETKAREAWDTLRYHFNPTDVPAIRPEDLHWPPSIEQVRLMYRTIAGRVHPDRGGPAEVFRKVTEARLALIAFLEVARPKPAEGGAAFAACDHCGGRGFIQLPSRTLGGRGLRKRCADCGGTGVTCH